MKKRKKKTKMKKIVLVMMVVLLAIGVAFIIKGCTVNGGYSDEKTFKEFASDEFKNLNKEDDLKGEIELQEEVNYKNTVAQAIYYPNVKNTLIDQVINEYIKEEKEQAAKFEKDNFNMVQKEKDTVKYEKAAFVTRYGTFKGQLDTGSILLTTEKFSQLKNEKLVKEKEEVKCINFLNEKKTPITFSSVFNPEKKEELVKFIGEELESTYKETLKDNYREVLNFSHFDNFILNKKGAEFIFNSNVLTTDKDSIRIPVSTNDVPGLFRDEIKARVLDPSKPMVALTFDDGPDPEYTEKIIDMLHANNAVGTFYLVGNKLETVQGTDRMLKKMIENGDEIGTHSYDHSNLFTLNDKQIKEQNDRTDKILMDLGGITATTYRPPFGNGNDKTTKIFNKAGILWSVDTEDWKSRDADSIVKEIKKVDDLNGHVILMHSIYDFSAKATKEIIPWLQEKGYQLVTVSELLQYKYNVNSEENKFYGYGYFHTVEK